MIALRLRSSTACQRRHWRREPSPNRGEVEMSAKKGWLSSLFRHDAGGAEPGNGGSSAGTERQADSRLEATQLASGGPPAGAQSSVGAMILAAGQKEKAGPRPAERARGVARRAA